MAKLGLGIKIWGLDLFLSIIVGEMHGLGFVFFFFNVQICLHLFS